MKILMISPGPADSHTSGSGFAAHKIAEALSSQLSLTVIQPEHVSVQDKKIRSETFSNTSVVKDITRIRIFSQVSPYLYADPIDIKQDESSEVRDELNLFTTGAFNEAKEVDFDLIYAHDWISFEAALNIKKAYKKPLVLHVHSLDVDRISSLNHSWIFDIERVAFEQADLILTVSHYTADRIEKFYQIHKRKIQVVYHGIDRPAKKEYPKKFEEPVVLFAGRLSGQKGPQAFIEIAEKVLLKKPKTRFIVAGDGDMRNDLLEMAAHKNIGHRVHFTGFLKREEMDAIYAEATVFCMPSVSEPFGLVALEAAAAHLPVVLSRQSGALEVLPQALDAEYTDIDGFVNHIVNLIDQTISVEKIVSENMASINRLSWEKTANEIVEVFKGLT